MADLKDEELKILKQGREKFSGDNPGPQNVSARLRMGGTLTKAGRPKL